jgi:hypothetical protein
MYSYLSVPVFEAAAEDYILKNTYGINDLTDYTLICLADPAFELEVAVAYVDIQAGLSAKYPRPPADFIQFMDSNSN